MSVMPDMPDSCWPVDPEACPELSTHPTHIQDVAIALAGQSMRMLTGYSVGGCPGTIRPCAVRCAANSLNWHWSNGTFHPVNLSGTWVNMTCGCGWDCGHSGAIVVVLPGYVSNVVEVLVDGVALDPSTYRVDNGNQLVRTDGTPWPTSQDMALATTEVGTFAVTYTAGAAVDGLGAYAAGVLACEYAKALTNGKCALPKSVTSVVRQGISMTLTPGAFPDGLTGIQVVDAYVLRWNPHRLKDAPAIWSPDTATGVHTTWAGS